MLNEDPSLRITQAYIVNSYLAFFPAFLRPGPEVMKPHFRFLAAGDPRALTLGKVPDAVKYREDLYRCATRGKSSHRFIQGLGPILNPAPQLAFSPDLMLDDVAGEDIPFDVWLVPGVIAPHTGLGHVPYLIDANWRFRLLNAPSSWPSFRLRMRMHIHLFAYGVANCLLCMSYGSDDGMLVSDFIRLLQSLGEWGRTKGLVFEVRHGRNKTEWNAEETAAAAFGQLGAELFLDHQSFVMPKRHANRLSSMVLLSHTIPPMRPDLHAKEMSGLVTREEKWQDNSDEYAAPFAVSDYGKRTGDWIKFGHHQAVVYVPSFTERERRSRRRFFWNLNSRVELARIQIFLFDHFGEELNELKAQWVRDRYQLGSYLRRQLKFETGYVQELRAFLFWDDLLGFHGRAVGAHSRAYALASKKTGLEEARGQFGERLAQLIEVGLREEPRPITFLKSPKTLLENVIPFLGSGI